MPTLWCVLVTLILMKLLSSMMITESCDYCFSSIVPTLFKDIRDPEHSIVTITVFVCCHFLDFVLDGLQAFKSKVLHSYCVWQFPTLYSSDLPCSFLRPLRYLLSFFTALVFLIFELFAILIFLFCFARINEKNKLLQKFHGNLKRTWILFKIIIPVNKMSNFESTRVTQEEIYSMVVPFVTIE